MNDVEYILDFTAELGCKMLTVGANLERVNDTMYRICQSYHLASVSIFSLSSVIIISAKSPDGQAGSRQVSIPYRFKHLEKLNRFNQLSRRVCNETPHPETLAGLLTEAEQVRDYSQPTIIIGYLIAMTSVGILNGGSISDIISADINTLILLWLTDYLSRRNINQIVANALCTWVVGSLAIFYVMFGLGEHYFIIVVVNSMFLVPGSDMVNAFRNLLCGNEMNGILEILKVILETLAIVFGIVLSIYMFGGFIQW